MVPVSEGKKTVSQTDDMSCFINQGSSREAETSLVFETEGIFLQKVGYTSDGKAEKPKRGQGRRAIQR